MKNHKIIFNFILCFFVFKSLNAQTVELIDFDVSNTSERIDTITYNTNKLWEVGVPNKIILKGAASPSSAIMTSISNSYPVNSSSSFTVSLNYGESLRFKHKYSTTKNKDGGVIEVSADKGNSWYSAFEYGDGSAFWIVENPFLQETDTLYNGEIGFSGTQTTWQIDSITICYLAVKTDFDLLIRFRFVSDNVFDNLDGWMFDDIGINTHYYCPGSVREIEQNKVQLFPNPAVNFVTLNFLSDEVSPARIEIFNEIGEKIVEQTMNLNFGNNKIPFSLDTFNNGIYFVQVNSKSGHSAAKLIVQK